MPSLFDSNRGIPVTVLESVLTLVSISEEGFSSSPSDRSVRSTGRSISSSNIGMGGNGGGSSVCFNTLSRSALGNQSCKMGLSELGEGSDEDEQVILCRRKGRMKRNGVGNYHQRRPPLPLSTPKRSGGSHSPVPTNAAADGWGFFMDE